MYKNSALGSCCTFFSIIFLLMAVPEATKSIEVEEPDRFDQLQGPTPPISLTMSINTTVYHLSTSLEGRPTLTFTLTSNLGYPITIFTHKTCLDPASAWDGVGWSRRFTALNLTYNRRVWLQTRQICRGRNFRRQLGDVDEKYFVTLLPGVPFNVSYQVHCTSWNTRTPGPALAFIPRSREFQGEEFRRHFEPGHKYRIGLATQSACVNKEDYIHSQFQDRRPSQVRLWWRYGSKEEVLAPRGAPMSEVDLGWSHKNKKIRGIPDVELVIEE